MLGIPIKDYKGNEAVVLAYAVSVTDTINSFPTLSFSFNATGQNLQIEGMIGPDTTFTVDGQQYRLTTSNPVPNTSYRVYAVTATHVGYDLHGIYQTMTLTGSQSLKACLDLMTQGTSFKYQIDGDFSDHDFGTDTIGAGHGDDILSSIAQAWACEYWFDNQTVHIAKTIGDTDSFVFVDRVNTTSISFNEDYSNMYTAIHGYGKQNEQETTSDDGSAVTTTSKSDFINYAKSFVGQVPYLWGGSSTSGWDCSGFVAYVYNHYGVAMSQPTTYEESQGSVVSPPYQTGDMLFWGTRGSTYHVALALDSNTLVMAANEQRGTVMQSISAWPPDFGVRNSSMSVKLQDTTTSDSNTTTGSPVTYTCEADYISPLVDKGVSKRWDSPYTSNTITDEATLVGALKAKLHDYPDVQYTMDWVSFKGKTLNFDNNIKVGNTGWIRDRYGTDVSVRIQSYTKYLDDQVGNNSTITFGNKIFNSSIWDTRSQQLADAQSLIKQEIHAQSLIKQEIQQMSTKQSIVRSDNVPTLTEKDVTNLEQYVGSNDQAK